MYPLICTRVLIRGKKCLFSGEFCKHTKRMMPLCELILEIIERKGSIFLQEWSFLWINLTSWRISFIWHTLILSRARWGVFTLVFQLKVLSGSFGLVDFTNSALGIFLLLTVWDITYSLLLIYNCHLHELCIQGVHVK